MADYSIVSDASATLLRLLREHLCPEPVPSPESVALASPNDKNGDFQLGVFLYEIKDLDEYRSASPTVTDRGVRHQPPRPLTLRYLLFVNNKAQMAAGAELEQRILGGAIQTVMDNSQLNLSGQNPHVEPEEERCAVSLLNLSFEEKSKVWAALSTPYQLGLYVEVTPVLISSRRVEQVSRVVSTQFDTRQMQQPRSSQGR